MRNGKLKLSDEFEQLTKSKVLRGWLESLRGSDWNVFLEGPPNGKSDPKDVLKYLTRYMTGGPIGDNRIESDEQGMVTFTARSNSKQKGKKNPPRPIEVSGAEFVRRWSLHVLPKSFTRSRCYGGYHGSRRKAYLEACRKLLPVAAVEDSVKPDPRDDLPKPAPKCPLCQIEMKCIAERPRPSWRELLKCTTDGTDYPKVALARTNTGSTLDQKLSRSHHRESLRPENLPLPEV